MELNAEFSKEKIEAAFRKITQAFQRLAELGWTVPMWATVPETVGLLEDYEEAAIDKAFIDLYTSSEAQWLQELSQDLLSHEGLSKWRSLIQECFDAYHRKLYLITIPALLSVIDGVIADSQSDDGIRLQRMLANKVAEVEARLPDSFTLAIWRSVNTFIKELFAHAPFTDSRPWVLNRHWILHGRDAANWTQADSLRLFQALHTISRIAYDRRDEWAS